MSLQETRAERAPAQKTDPPGPELTFLVLHRGMRNDSARLAAAVASLHEADRTTRGAALARWFEGFSTELHDHHTIEDDIFAPALRDRVPEAAPLVARIDVDHAHLTDLIERTTAALARLREPTAPFRAAHAEAVKVTDGLRALLQSHLDFEDADVVPVFGERFTAEENAAMHKQAEKRVRLRHLAFVIPWAMDNAPEAAAGRRAVRLQADLVRHSRPVSQADRGGVRLLSSPVNRSCSPRGAERRGDVELAQRFGRFREARVVRLDVASPGGVGSEPLRPPEPSHLLI